MRRLLPHLLALSVAAAAGCKDTPSLGPAPVASMAPVPQPAGLVAEVMIPKPAQTWTRLRTLIGGPAAMLPQSFGMGAAMLLGLSPKVAELIDGDVPAVGAVTSDGAVELAVLAIHVRDGQKVIDDMTTGPQARHLARVDAVSKVTLIEPKPGETSLNASMGVTGNFLLIGYAPDALLKVGPYAARTVSTRAMPAEERPLYTILNRQLATEALLLGVLFGAFLGFGQLAWHGVLLRSLARQARMLIGLIIPSLKPQGPVPPELKHELRFGVALALGALVTVWDLRTGLLAGLLA